MAKISIDIDTATKSVMVKVGKQELSNVGDIYISTEDAGYFMVELVQREEEDGMRKTTRLTAAQEEEWKEVEGEVSKIAKEMSEIWLNK